VANNLLGSDNYMTDSRVVICSGRWDYPGQVERHQRYTEMYNHIRRGIERQSILLGRFMSIPAEQIHRGIVNRSQPGNPHDREWIVRNLFTNDMVRLEVRIDREIENWCYEEVIDAVFMQARTWSLQGANVIRGVARQITFAIVHGRYVIGASELRNMILDAESGRINQEQHSLLESEDDHGRVAIARVRENLLRRTNHGIGEQDTNSVAERVDAHNQNNERQNSPVNL
jgi:hypothetical protein